jgi:hypothetical protein
MLALQVLPEQLVLKETQVLQAHRETLARLDLKVYRVFKALRVR